MKADTVVLHHISEAEALAHGLKPLYEGAFPVEERRPWSSFSALPPEFGFYLILDGCKPVGMLTLWRFDEFAYIEHFAVYPHSRGGGIGSRALEAAAELAGDFPLVLEAEPEASGPMARRRIEFYRRNGFTAHCDFSYMQPPYLPGLPSVPLTLLSRGSVPDLAAVAAVLRNRVYGYDENNS